MPAACRRNCAGALFTASWVVGLVVWLIVRYACTRRGTEGTGAARRILAEWYAPSELDTEEYTSGWLGCLT